MKEDVGCVEGRTSRQRGRLQSIPDGSVVESDREL